MGKEKPSSKVSIWVISISILALFISIFTFYMNYLKPFKVDATFGGYVLFPDISETEKIPKLNIGVTILLYNKGAKSGLIEDFAIKVERMDAEDEKVNYYPYLYFDYQDFVDRMLKNEPYAYSYREGFSGIYLKPGESCYKEIVFGARKTKTPIQYIAGKYRFSHYIKLRGKDVELVETRIREFYQNTITNIYSGIPKVLLPFEWRTEFDIKQGVRED